MGTRGRSEKLVETAREARLAPWARSPGACGGLPAVTTEGRQCEYVGKADLDWLIAEVERLAAEHDVIRGIVGHPGTNVLPEDAPLSEVVRHTHHQWLVSQQATNQRVLAAEAERDAAIQRAEVAGRELAKIRDYLAQERKRQLLSSLRGEEDASYE